MKEEDGDDDDVGLNVLGCRADILFGTKKKKNRKPPHLMPCNSKA